jgi:hypothetical protein
VADIIHRPAVPDVVPLGMFQDAMTIQPSSDGMPWCSVSRTSLMF